MPRKRPPLRDKPHLLETEALINPHAPIIAIAA